MDFGEDDLLREGEFCAVYTRKVYSKHEDLYESSSVTPWIVNTDTSVSRTAVLSHTAHTGWHGGTTNPRTQVTSSFHYLINLQFITTYWILIIDTTLSLEQREDIHESIKDIRHRHSQLTFPVCNGYLRKSVILQRHQLGLLISSD